MADVTLRIEIEGITYVYPQATIVDGALLQRDAIRDGRHERDSIEVSVLSPTLGTAASPRELPAGRFRAAIERGGQVLLDGRTSRVRTGSSRAYGASSNRIWSITIEDDALSLLIERLDALDLYPRVAQRARALDEAAGQQWRVADLVTKVGDSLTNQSVFWYDVQGLLLAALDVLSTDEALVAVAGDHDWFETLVPYLHAGQEQVHSFAAHLGLCWMPRVMERNFNDRHNFCPRMSAGDLFDLAQTLSRFVVEAHYEAFPSQGIEVRFHPGLWPLAEPETQEVAPLTDDPDETVEEARERDAALRYAGEIQPAALEEYYAPPQQATYAASRWDLREERQDDGAFKLVAGNATIIEVDVRHPQFYFITAAPRSAGNYYETLALGMPHVGLGDETEDVLYLCAITQWGTARRAVAYREVLSPIHPDQSARFCESWASQLWPRQMRVAHEMERVTLDVPLHRLDAIPALGSAADGLTYAGRAYEVAERALDYDKGVASLVLRRPAAPIQRYAATPLRQAPIVEAWIAEAPFPPDVEFTEYEYFAHCTARDQRAALPASSFEIQWYDEGASSWTAYEGPVQVAGPFDHVLFRARGLYDDGAASAWTEASTDPNA